MRSTCVVLLLCVGWSLATPLGGAPDEPAQIVKAAATAHGELFGQSTPNQVVAYRSFEVPFVFQSIYSLPTCYQFKPSVPAGCAPTLKSGARLVSVVTYVGRYPPLYYAAVGLPSLVLHSEDVIYLMRMVSDLLDALLLGLALAVARTWCRRSMMLECLGLALTPLVFFYCSVVNPSGFEMAAAICVWTSGLALLQQRGKHPPSLLVVIVSASSCRLVLTRGLSVLWMALVLLTLFILDPPTSRRLMANRMPQRGLAILGGVAAIAAGFVLWNRTLEVVPSTVELPLHSSLVHTSEVILGNLGVYLQQLIGVFGWLDTPSPLLAVILWSSAMGFVILLALLASRSRQSKVLLGLIVGSVIVTVGILVLRAGSDNITWQARDGFPLYVGIPLVAGAILPRTSLLALGSLTARRVAVLFALVVGLSQLTDFLWALRRNTVGLESTLDLFRAVPNGWSPPLGSVTIVLVGTIAVSSYACYFYRAISRNNPPEPAAAQVRREEMPGASVGPAGERIL
jgi:hypothetical protein